jgi:hypothetical protein
MRTIGDRESIVDEYCEHLEQRWNEGCHNATQFSARLSNPEFVIVRTFGRISFGRTIQLSSN